MICGLPLPLGEVHSLAWPPGPSAQSPALTRSSKTHLLPWNSLFSPSYSPQPCPLGCCFQRVFSDFPNLDLEPSLCGPAAVRFCPVITCMKQHFNHLLNCHFAIRDWILMVEIKCSLLTTLFLEPSTVPDRHQVCIELDLWIPEVLISMPST